MKPVYSIVGGSPDNAFPVFKESADIIARQAFGPFIMIHSVSMHTKDPVVCGANPKVAVAVETEGEDRDLASIKSRGHERPDGAIHESGKSSPRSVRKYADPHGTIGPACQAHYPRCPHVGFQTSDRVHLRHPGMPVDKGSLSSEPKTASPICQNGINRGNRNSIRFAVALDPVLIDVANGLRNSIVAAHHPDRAVSVFTYVERIRLEPVQLNMRRHNPVFEVSDPIGTECPEPPCLVANDVPDSPD